MSSGLSAALVAILLLLEQVRREAKLLRQWSRLSDLRPLAVGAVPPRELVPVGPVAALEAEHRDAHVVGDGRELSNRPPGYVIGIEAAVLEAARSRRQLGCVGSQDRRGMAAKLAERSSSQSSAASGSTSKFAATIAGVRAHFRATTARPRSRERVMPQPVARARVTARSGAVTQAPLGADQSAWFPACPQLG